MMIEFVLVFRVFSRLGCQSYLSGGQPNIIFQCQKSIDCSTRLNFHKFQLILDLLKTGVLTVDGNPQVSKFQTNFILYWSQESQISNSKLFCLCCPTKTSIYRLYFLKRLHVLPGFIAKYKPQFKHCSIQLVVIDMLKMSSYSLY